MSLTPSRRRRKPVTGQKEVGHQGLKTPQWSAVTARPARKPVPCSLQGHGLSAPYGALLPHFEGEKKNRSGESGPTKIRTELARDSRSEINEAWLFDNRIWKNAGTHYDFVMPGLEPGIHVLLCGDGEKVRRGMAGSSPAMTTWLDTSKIKPGHDDQLMVTVPPHVLHFNWLQMPAKAG